jgi:hypothetical protein
MKRSRLLQIIKEEFHNIIKEESTQYNLEGLLHTNTSTKNGGSPQKAILSDIRSLPGVTIVSSVDFNADDTAFNNTSYYTVLTIKIDPHPYSDGFTDEDLQGLLDQIRQIKGVNNFKLRKPVEKTKI